MASWMKDVKPVSRVAVGKDTVDKAGKNGQVSPGMMQAIEGLDDEDDHDPRYGCVKYYRIQSNQELGSQRVQAPVFIDSSLDDSWLSPVQDAIKVLNVAAPGLQMYEVDSKSAAKIWVHGNERGKASTRGNIVLSSLTEVSLASTWSESAKRGTAIHELMHALGFQHEHKRRDGEQYMDYDNTRNLSNKDQYEVEKKILGLSRFDPHSIMMYSLCYLKRKPDGDFVWKTKTGDERCQVLSELDKVGLNILYRPVAHEKYRPSKAKSVSGLNYCGRPFFTDAEKDVIKRAHTDGVCGPNNWANCAACRVLKSSKSEKIHALKKWQGWTGLVYCGKYFGKVYSCHDGYCGPNNGPPCTECGDLLYPGYEEDWCLYSGSDYC